MSVKNSDQEDRNSCPEPLAIVRIAADLRNVLHYHRQLGIDQYPAGADLDFKGKPEKFIPPPVIRARQRKAVEEKKTAAASPPDTGETLEELFHHIRACGECPSRLDYPLKAPNLLPEKIRLMIIGDYRVDKVKDTEQLFFGREEDKMLARMVEALDLTMDEVYVTNCIKCFCHPEALPGQKDTDHCLSFLAREIAAVRPPVICTMGELSARIVLGVNKPLVRLRGVFHRYRYYEQYPVEVMPTYHPRFLLEHTEMKRATWSDLLLIQRKYLQKR